MFQRIPPAELNGLNPQRICLIKPSALGDVVQTLPLLPALKHRFPEARISWVVSRELRDLVDGHPDLTESIPFDRNGGWTAWLKLLTTLRRRRFDLVFDLQGLLRTGVMTAATGAPTRVGLQTAREGSWFTLNCVIPETPRLMAAHARYWRVAEALGLGDAPQKAFVATSGADEDWAAGQLSQLPRPIFALHPGARWMTKRWPVAKFAELAVRAGKLWSGTVLILGSKAEQSDAEKLEKECAHRMGFLNPMRIANMAGQSTLKQLSALLKSVDFVVSNDSGPMHLAAGLGTPTLGLFTCTSADRSGPAGDQHEMVSTTVACASGYHKTCPIRGAGHLACHDELTVDRVWLALQRLVEKNRSVRRVA